MPEPQIAMRVALLEPLNANPFFETTAAPWSPYGATFTRSTTQAYQGTASGLLTPDGVTSGVAVGSELVPTLPSVTHRVQTWVRANVAGTLQLGINWYNSGIGYLGEAVTTVNLPADVWTQLDHTADSPATTAYGQVKVVLPGVVPPWHLVYIDATMILATWTDLAGRLHYGDGGGPLTIDIGRQTELQDIEPTRIAATLKNGDGWLTPRNPASPYYGTWEQGRQVRVTETVDGEEIDLATGLLEIPDVQVNSPNVDQPCSISAVDRLGRLAGAAPFISALGEHIRAFGGTLVDWWPLSEPSWPFQSALTDGVGKVKVNGFREFVQREPEGLILTTAKEGPAGDDLSYALWEPVLNDVGTQTLAWATVTAPLNIAVGPSDTLAISVWVNATTQDAPPGARPEASFLTLSTGAGFGIAFQDEMEGLTVFVTGLPDAVGSRELERDAWRLVTVRVNFATGVVDLWVGHDLFAGSSGTLPAGVTLTTMSLATNFAGSLAQLQIRVGPAATTMTRVMHLEQYTHGHTGLHRQTVAQRITTLAGYAGVPASELDLPGEASTPLQVAKLANANPSQALQDAATAGQDTLMTTPQGRITLVPRSRRYNQPVTMNIPFGWITQGGIRYRPDKPVTDTVASRTGGGTARRVSGPLRARYGALARTVTLDTAVDADPANWVSWTLTAFGQPRTRCPLLRINLLNRTVTDRKALLRLRVGDRIQLADMPPNSPEDVPHLIVQGIRHIIGPHRIRVIEFNTSPLLGPVPGAPPACPVVGDLVSNTAIIAY